MIRIYCIGCSWSQGYPDFIEKAHKVPLHGHGLWYIHDVMNDLDLSKFEKIIVQLPTPIRFKGSGGDTLKTMNEFIMNGMTDKKLLEAYKKEIKSIFFDYQRCTFLLYNTGGYPFRYPWDFGEDVENEMLMYMADEYIPHIYVKLGDDHDTKSYNDMHPSTLADKKCAEIVKRYL